MERLTDCAQGYCEMYCKKYGHCFGDPGDCIFKDEIKLYEAVKSIEGIVPFDRLLELACADKAGRLVVLPCKVGDTVYMPVGKWNTITGYEADECDGFHIARDGVLQIKAKCYSGNHGIYGVPGKTCFLTREEAEAALVLKGGESDA